MTVSAPRGDYLWPAARTLVEIAHALESADDIDARLHRALALLHGVIPYDECALLAVLPGEALRLYHVPEDASTDAAGLRALLERRYRLLADIGDASDDRGPPADRVPWASSLSVPLLALDRVMGILLVGRHAPEAYGEEDLSLLAVVAAQLGAYLSGVFLREQEAQRVRELEAVINTVVEGLAILDASGAVLHANPAWLRLFGLPSQEAALRNLGDYDAICELERPDGSALPWFESPFGAPLAGQTVAGAEVRACCPDGRMITLSVNGAPVRDEHGAVAMAVVTCVDVTEAREQERLRDEFIATASHELKTPLATINMQTQLLLRRRTAIERADLERALALIQRQSARLARLLDLLLDASRIQAGTLHVSPERMDLVVLVRERAADVQVSTDAHRLTVSAPAQPVYGRWERDRLGQVLDNLLRNAVKYSPAGGEIVVRVLEQKDGVTVEVTDPGIGVPAEHLPRLFRRFYRGSYAARERIPGSGLGLFIAKGIVEAHGGRIWAHSEGPGRGATFGFHLPRETPT